MPSESSRRVLTLRNPPPQADAVETAQGYEEELSALKNRLANAKAQIFALQTKLQHDGNLPVMRTSAFVNEVKARRSPEAVHHKRVKGPGCLAEVTVINLTAILERYGDRATDAVLTHVAKLLGGHVRDTDKVGRLGTASFGVLLAFADPTGATTKMEKLCEKIENTPLEWEDKTINVCLELRTASLDS